MKKITKTVVILALLAISVMVISGCNTFDGLGKDIEGTGQAIQDVAN